MLDDYVGSSRRKVSTQLSLVPERTRKPAKWAQLGACTRDSSCNSSIIKVRKECQISQRLFAWQNWQFVRAGAHFSGFAGWGVQGATNEVPWSGFTGQESAGQPAFWARDAFSLPLRAAEDFVGDDELPHTVGTAEHGGDVRGHIGPLEFGLILVFEGFQAAQIVVEFLVQSRF